MKIAVAGGTGVVGAPTVAALRAAGHDPVVLTRSTGTDLTSAVGLADRLAGVDAVIDVTSTVTTSARTATRFFTTTTGNLLEAGRTAGVRHHVLLSIVGIDDCPFGYYVGKVAQEELVNASPVPSTIVRATQFHEFAGQMVERASFAGLTVVPRMTCAPIAAREVADALVATVTGDPHGYAPEVSGPRTEQLDDMARRWVRRRGSRRPVLGAPLPGKAGRAMRNGTLVPTSPGITGVQTYDAWLAEQEPPARPGADRR